VSCVVSPHCAAELVILTRSGCAIAPPASVYIHTGCVIGDVFGVAL